MTNLNNNHPSRDAENKRFTFEKSSFLSDSDEDSSSRVAFRPPIFMAEGPAMALALSSWGTAGICGSIWDADPGGGRGAFLEGCPDALVDPTGFT